jgi:hypothetical protein
MILCGISRDLQLLIQCAVVATVCPVGLSQDSGHLPAIPKMPPENTTVCDVAGNEASIGTQPIRLRGRVYWVLGELVMREGECRLLLEPPVTIHAKAASAGGQSVTAAHNLEVPGRHKSDAQNVQKFLRYVYARVAPTTKDVVCLVCGRYLVRATITGHFPPLVTGAGGRTESNATRAPLPNKPMQRRLIIDSVSNVTASDLYGTFYSRNKYKPVPAS